MSVELTNEEKIQIINSHIKNLKTNKYNLQISIVQENSVETPVTEKIAKLNSEISDANSRITALEAEIASIQAK
jgi:type I restriction-modification system DNA methylase subunit